MLLVSMGAAHGAAAVPGPTFGAFDPTLGAALAHAWALPHTWAMPHVWPLPLIVLASLALFGSRRPTPLAHHDQAIDLPPVFDDLPLACLAWDLSGRIIYLNPACESHLGRTAASLREARVWEALAPAAQRAKLQDMVQRVLAGESIVASEGQDALADGGARHVLRYAFPLRGANGTIVGGMGAHVDISSFRRDESELARSEARYREIFENAVEGIFQCAPDGRFISANPAMARLLGYDSAGETIRNLTALDKFPYVEAGRRQEFISTLRAQGHIEEFESEIRRPNGTVIWISENARLVRDEATGKELCEGSVEDISKRKMAEQRLVRHAFHDKLTGLPDRALFLDRLDQFIKRTARNERYLFAVLFLDLDRFKNVNDSLGHMMGDQLLVSTARKLEACLRSGDTVARLGGDEFAILLDDINDVTDATTLAERIQNRLVIPFSLNGQEVFSTASIGIAIGKAGSFELEELLHNADVAMYRAKSLGGARYEVFDTAMHARAKTLVQLEAELHRAVERSEFRVEYQPLVSLSMGSIVGFEALVRWQHPKRGLVSPGEFVTIMEDTGLIVPIGYWVLREACAQLAKWQRTGRGSHVDLLMSVNLSVRQFAQPDLIKQIESIMRETGIDAHHLKLEITESVIMGNPDTAIAVLKQLKDLKIKLSMDDFGTGYSSLSYLHRFPFDVLKIDRSFVSQMDTADKNEEIVRTIVSLAHNLNMEVIAEGVETDDQFEHLKALGCHYGQGYYFSGSMDGPSATILLRAAPQW